MQKAALDQFYQQYLLEPAVKRIQNFPCQANWITALACLSGVLILPVSYVYGGGAAVGILLITGYLDTLDGAFARATLTDSDLGAVYDIVSDRIVEIAIIWTLYMVSPDDRGVWLLGLLSSIFFCVTCFLVVGIVSNKESAKSFYYSPALIERAEAFIVFGLMFLLPSGFMFLCVSLTVGILYSGLQHIIQYRRQVINA